MADDAPRSRVAARAPREGPGEGPGFDRDVPAAGYAWWYVDALSDDGRYGLTLIAFVGSVFSPYYARSGRRDPLDHCALNVALYRRGGRGDWAMTERRAASVARTPDVFQVGPSSLSWDGAGLAVAIDEATTPFPSPFPRPLRGTVRVIPEAICAARFGLDAAGRHVWRPIAPHARVEARFESPALSWTGDGYFDANAGDEPLEDGFVRWDWARAHHEREALVLYDVVRADGSEHALALRFDGAGQPIELAAPPRHALPPTGWGVARSCPADAPGGAQVLQTFENTPFYARSLVRAEAFGATHDMMHESLSCTRLRASWVKALLPFRMPRERRARPRA